MKHLSKLVFLLLLCLFAIPAHAQDFWGKWPDKCDPKATGKLLATNLLDRSGYYLAKTGGLQYPEVCTAYGALRFADATHDQELVDKIIARYQAIISPNGQTPDGKQLTRPAISVDSGVFGALPFEIYLLNHDDRYLQLGKKSADAQWESPRDDGLTSQTRFWIDDMFMITALQVQAYRATHDPIYLDRAAKEMVAYLDKLQQPNGLFYHGENAEHYWGRGDGWVAVGMAELLLSLPDDHPQRARIMDGYHKMMAALLKYQSDTGMWRQLIDNPDAWPESSGTGMFTFAMAVGVKHGWLDAAAYKEPTRKAWIALCADIDEKGNVKEVCEGTNKNPDTQFYLDRQRKTGDFHGQAAAIWAAWALLD